MIDLESKPNSGSNKTYDDYRKISLEKRTDRCPNCGFRKNKKSRICSSCKEKLNRKNRNVDNEDDKSYCQYGSCPNRLTGNERYLRKNMKKYRTYVFCRNECLEDYKKERL